MKMNNFRISIEETLQKPKITRREQGFKSQVLALTLLLFLFQIRLRCSFRLKEKEMILL